MEGGLGVLRHDDRKSGTFWDLLFYWGTISILIIFLLFFSGAFIHYLTGSGRIQ